MLGLSGGRDSTYLLYYLARVMGLRVFAYYADNGFSPAQNERIVKRTTEMLGVDLHVERHGYLKKCIKHYILAWMRRPSAALITTVCTGCRLGIYKGLFSFAVANKIPVVISGGTPFEEAAYKTNLLRVTARSRRISSVLVGYLYQVVRNPRCIMKPCCLAIQLEEFRYHLNRRRIYDKNGITLISPFYNHLHWKENDVVATVTRELNWESNPKSRSTWKADCSIAFLKSNMYRSTLGFNDKDDHLSWLVRDGQINREEAMDRLRSEEQEIPKDVIEDIMAQLGIDYLDFESALKRAVWV